MIKIWGQIKDSKLPDIETERLYLRQRLISDADDIFAYASLPEVTWPASVFHLQKVWKQRHIILKTLCQSAGLSRRCRLVMVFA